jgi:hypothetical protein
MGFIVIRGLRLNEVQNIAAGRKKKMQAGYRQVTVSFQNGNSISVEFPIQAGEDAVTAISNIKKVLDADRILIEVDGDLMIIPWESVTHIRVHPAPESLPRGIIIRGARVVKQEESGI